MIIAGIDYSMSCPGICVHDSDSGKFSFMSSAGEFYVKY